MTQSHDHRRLRIWSSVAVAVLLLTVTASQSSAGATPTRPARAMSPSVDQPDPSPGCGTSTVGSITRERRTIDVAGTERWYLLSTPPAHDGHTPLPLVVEFHGLGEGAPIAALMGRMDDLGAREGFVTAFPNGTGSPLRWDVSLTSNPNRDFEFVRDILDTLGRDLCIDRSRVYAIGLSYGAFMSSALACVMADRFAAIAPVAGIQRQDGCEPSRPVPILAFHGTQDPILHFNGGFGFGAKAGGEGPADLNGPGYPANVARWAAANGCGPEATDTHVTPHVIRRTYHCPVGADVVFMIILGGGHSWPGSAFSASIAKIVGPTTMEIDASCEIWRFLRQYRLGSPGDPLLPWSHPCGRAVRPLGAPSGATSSGAA